MRRWLRSMMLLTLALALMAAAAPAMALEQRDAAFSVSTRTMIKDMARYTISIKIDGEDQRFGFKASDVTSFVIKSMSRSGRTQTVKAVAHVNRRVATVKVNVTLKYRYSGGRWKLLKAKFPRAVLLNVHLLGDWTGTYTTLLGKAKVDIKISGVSRDGYITSGLFSYSALPTNPIIPSGSYTLKGGYERSTGRVLFAGNEWVVRPLGHVMVDIHAKVDLINKRIISDLTNWSLSIRKL